MRIVLLLSFLLIPCFALAEHPNTPAQTKGIIPTELRPLLIKEMQAIDAGMARLSSAVATGDWAEIAQIGHAIKNTYILQQQLTKQQRHQLHSSLPAAFKKLDHQFHYYAGMLHHVAKERDLDLVHFYVYKMNESCTACHAQFAAQRFTGFNEPNKHKKHIHQSKHHD